MSSQLVEDCLKIVKDHFELAVVVAYRAQEISSSSSAAFFGKMKHKSSILALKEIAQHKIEVPQVVERIITSFRQYTFLEDIAVEPSVQEETATASLSSETKETARTKKEKQ